MILFEVVTTNEEANEKLRGLCFIRKPVVGRSLSIMYYDNFCSRVQVWETSTIENIEVKCGEKKLVVKTKNSTYYLFLYHNSPYDEIVEDLFICGLKLKKAKEIAEHCKTMKPSEIIDWLHRLSTEVGV